MKPNNDSSLSATTRPSLTEFQEAEQQVLACMINSKPACDQALNFLDQDDFTNSRHKLLFQAILALYNNQRPIDLTTLADELLKQKTFNQVGGTEYLSELMDLYINDLNLDEYLKMIAERTTLRNLEFALTQIKTTLNSGQAVSTVLNEAERAILNVAKDRSPTHFKAIRGEIDALMAKINALSMRKTDLIGTPAGIGPLDNITAGFQSGDLIILAGRPSMGKTALALNFALNAALKLPSSSVAIFSLEMPHEQIMQRVLSLLSAVNLNSLRTGKHLKNEDWSRMSAATDQLKKTNIYVDDTPGLSIVELQSKLRKLTREQSVCLVVVDYLQLLVDGSQKESRQQEVANISRQLKSLARELKVPIICLSQLSRLVERREDKRPLMSDLRESGAIEQDADLIMFLYRPDYYERNEEDRDSLSQKSELIISKHRNGPTGTVELGFLQRYGKFDALN